MKCSHQVSIARLAKDVHKQTSIQCYCMRDHTRPAEAIYDPNDLLWKTFLMEVSAIMIASDTEMVSIYITIFLQRKVSPWSGMLATV